MKGQEYGRFVVVDGHRKLVRYIIFRLDCEFDDIRVLNNVITSYWIAGLCRAHPMLLVMPLFWFIEVNGPYVSFQIQLMSFESPLRGRKPRRGSSLQRESLLLPLWMTPNSTQLLKYLGWRNQRLLLWVRLTEHHNFLGWIDLLFISFNLFQKSAKVKVTKSTYEDIFGMLPKMNQMKAATAASNGKLCHVLPQSLCH